MNILEKEMIFIISRLRCLTENQLNKLFGTKQDPKRRTIKRTLRRMCNDYILVKLPCNINYRGYKDNSYVYYINGSKLYRGEVLLRTLIGSEIAVKINTAKFEILRFYRNINMANKKFDLYIEYVNTNTNETKQVLVDILLDKTIDISKYSNISSDLQSCTIPFFMVPNIIVVTNYDNIELRELERKNIFFVNTSLNSIYRCL